MTLHLQLAQQNYVGNYLAVAVLTTFRDPIGETFINAAYLRSSLVGSTLSQTLGPLTPGATYNLTYLLRNDFNPTDNFTNTNSWTATVGNVVLDSLVAFPPTDFMIRSFLFTAPLGSTTLPLVFTYRQVKRPTPCQGTRATSRVYCPWWWCA